ncbi:MAG: hypothetical protein A2428_01020 [Bdellovibrionales bacterium RIFOXYC1_FULL_54_43]|nr:MAG: hypothetical protein A2428_01020 [Bdellovibrionales bacterium RIFOXYC1_FULL_54_43]OFZ82866.1 MAG: hypothetical protein A2603_11745 [Bdellovibrionales bacterium RIFOXYD1_FULL_55_31]
MDKIAVVDIGHHRSRQRIKDLGEVFTPDKYVEKMLGLFEKKLWADPNTIFFEPSVGHGNIAVPILARRIDALTDHFLKEREREPVLCAIATALNTLWAVDICPLNISYARHRLFEHVIRHLVTNGVQLRTTKMSDYLTHVICTLVWQVQENEALSSLSTSGFAPAQASKTRLGAEWIANHGHKPVNFANDWCQYFQNSDREKAVPILFTRANRFLSKLRNEGAKKGFEEFHFAQSILEKVFDGSKDRKAGVA